MLQSTFVFSTTINFPTREHIKQYDHNVLQCSNHLLDQILHHAYELRPESKHYQSTTNRYKIAAGKVIYDLDEQKIIAQKIIFSLEDNIFGNKNIHDIFKFRYIRDELLVILTIDVTNEQHVRLKSFLKIFIAKIKILFL